ncbi:MAG: hypothetical protein JWO74_2876 [Solirubrobacterales bacterium]|nr:hypothetical protein [Solirubrobacterales bacterium]
MPLEGHWQRQHTSLRSATRRERRVLLLVLGILTAALIAIVVAASWRGAGASTPGCVDATVPSTTGGASIHACGARALRFCHSADPIPADVLGDVRAACRKAGLGGR